MNEEVEWPSLGLFCDFDGTIAVADMLTAIMTEFAAPASEPIIKRIVAGEIDIKRGVQQLFGLLPSSAFPAVREFAVERVVLRPGFPRFVALCRDRGWRLVVVSGGFDFFVEPSLKPFREDLTLYCNSLDLSGPTMRVIWNVPCDEACVGGCGLCKPSVMRLYQGRVATRIVIGDGVTDARAAQQADFVFARDRLQRLCEEENMAHMGFDTFDEIADELERRYRRPRTDE